MKAIVVKEELPGRPLVWEDVPDPVCGPDDILVDVHATALNRADLMQRAGGYPVPPGASQILGLEMAGTIAGWGSCVLGWQKGNRVRALLTGGGYAEQVVLPARMLIAMPDDRDFIWGAALPEAVLTAYLNLFMEAGLQTGETVLIHGGASGVGTYGIQMARLAGCRVLVTAGSEAKLAACRELGAELAVNYKEEDFVERIRNHLGGAEVDVVMDMVGGPYLERNMGLLRTYGRLVIISTLGGAESPIHLGHLMRPRLRLIGSVLRPRSVDEKVAIMKSFKRRFLGNLLDGSLKPIIDSVYPVERAEDAQAHMAANRNIGKVMLQVRG